MICGCILLMCISPSAAPWSRITIERHGIIIIPRRYYDKVRLKLLYIDDCENGLHEFCDSDHPLVSGIKQWMEFTVCRGAPLYTVSWLILRCWEVSRHVFVCCGLNEWTDCTYYTSTNWFCLAVLSPLLPDALPGTGVSTLPPF